MLKIRRTLISVSDKSGIVEFANGLCEFQVEIISTGGTFKLLKEQGIPVTPISEITQFPEILDGRVKTLHPKIHGALLAVQNNPSHVAHLKQHEIEPIDLVVVNLYPLEQTMAKNGVSLEEAIAQIDIGGPTMLRSAAKNFQCKAVVTSPSQYSVVLDELKRNQGSISSELCFELAKQVFRQTSYYDSVISEFLNRQDGEKAALPDMFTLAAKRSELLRYGENPHQQAALYGNFSRHFQRLHGKQLSYNNVSDMNAAAYLCAEFDQPTAVIIKHTNPCGVGSDHVLAQAYRKALATDSTSAFGGTVAVNRPLDRETAESINEIFTEVIIAPGFPEEVLKLLKKKKDRRVLMQRVDLRSLQEYEVKKVVGGLLVQEPDGVRVTEEQLNVVTKRKPTAEEVEAMLFAWRVAKHVKSNAIVYALKDRTIGIGAGQMSRVGSSKLAVRKAQEAGLTLEGTAVASDAFFPFSDGLLEAVKAGATAVIQPGGSIRDEEVIRAADDHHITMVFTGVRHFKH
ncbi:MAG: bifunctional phosphoribosylaminoimidazolecarboxamide formyltransferase/IMP cyclohydrolase [Bacteroidota bacterium]